MFGLELIGALDKKKIEQFSNINFICKKSLGILINFVFLRVMAWVILKNIDYFKVYAKGQIPKRGSKMMILWNFVKLYIQLFEYKLLNIPRFFRLETRFTVYRALNVIPEHSGEAKRCLGQRLSILWTRKT